MTDDPTGTFDFSQEAAPKDVVVRSIDVEDEERWVDVLVTPSGHRCFWNYHGFDSFQEAAAWLATIKT